MKTNAMQLAKIIAIYYTYMGVKTLDKPICKLCGNKMNLDDLDKLGYSIEYYYICDCGTSCTVKSYKGIEIERTFYFGDSQNHAANN